MKRQIKNVFENTGRVLGGIHASAREAGPTARNNDWMLLMALAPAVIAAFTLTEVGAWVVGEIGRQIRIREKRPASASLRGTPTPKELAADWGDQPRSLETCLRLGSRLADLDPTLDHTLIRERLPNGKMVIRARKGGMKGWLLDHRVEVGYSTVMRYKKLAQRLRQALALDDRIPLEWVMSGLPEGQTLPAELAGAFSEAGRRLGRLMKENPTLKALSLAVEKALGIVRLVAVRRVGKGCVKRRKTHNFSIISLNRAVRATPERVEATREAMGRVLRAKGLAGGALHLQNRLRRWLRGVGRDEAAGMG